jgi:hypothetical protein
LNTRRGVLLSRLQPDIPAGRQRVEESLLTESWNEQYAQLGFDPNDAEPPFLKPAVEELAKADE